MRNLLIIITIMLITSSKAHSLTYKKLENLPTSQGWVNTEGFHGVTNDFPNCIKLKQYFPELDTKLWQTGITLRQGLKVFFKPDGSISSTSNGLYDCKLVGGKIVESLDEGIAEFPEYFLVFFKKENFKLHSYYFDNKTKLWFYVIRPIDYAAAADYESRQTTREEDLHAEKLLKIYRNLDLSSPTAKVYSSLFEIINQTENKQIKKTQEQAPTKKQSESGVAAELERLQKLLNSGAITKDEYQKAKNKVLK